MINNSKSFFRNELLCTYTLGRLIKADYSTIFFLLFSASNLLGALNFNVPFPITELIFIVQRYRIAGSSQWKDRKREKKSGSLYTTGYVSWSSVMPLQNGALTSCFWRTMIHRSHAICLNAGSFPDISRDANSNCEMHRELLRFTCS